jgi:hypothetical protein
MKNHNPAVGPTIGRISGSAQVEIRMDSTPIIAGNDHPADVYANFVKHQVQAIMDSTGNVPRSIKVSLQYDGDE